MRKRIAILAGAAFFAVAAVAIADSAGFNVVPSTYDPAHTYLVASNWIAGIGCPTNARTFDGSTTGTYTDPACPTGDPKDRQNEGLLLAKTGPTANFAAAQADIVGVRGITLTEVGYDLRKPLMPSDPRGSHCGAGSPRFNITTQDGVLHFIGCNSPPPTVASSSNAWQRLRWNPATAFPPIPPGSKVKSIQIVADEGQDTGPDNFGLSVLDNIDINGTLVGEGPDGGHGGDGHGDGGGYDH
jgi:hypothetical protein